jgi:hypothetical protein
MCFLLNGTFLALYCEKYSRSASFKSNEPNKFWQSNFYMGVHNCIIAFVLFVIFPSYGQTVQQDSNRPIEDDVAAFYCPIQVSCFTLSDGKLIKPLRLNREFKGIIIVGATHDTLLNRFTHFYFKYARLTYKKSGKQYLFYSIYEKEDMPALLKELMPDLIWRIKHLSLKKTGYKDCITPVEWGFPIRVQ